MNKARSLLQDHALSSTEACAWSCFACVVDAFFLGQRMACQIASEFEKDFA